jgi:hypothetical protein
MISFVIPRAYAEVRRSICRGISTIYKLEKDLSGDLEMTRSGTLFY